MIPSWFQECSQSEEFPGEGIRATIDGRTTTIPTWRGIIYDKAMLDKAVAASGYLVGHSLTYADCNILPMLVALTMFPATDNVLHKNKNLVAYVSGLSARPSFKNTAPPAN